MALAKLLHAIQHLTYGYELSAHASPESFLDGVMAASPRRRLWALLGAGVVAGFGWYGVHRSHRKLVSVRAAVGEIAPGPPMPAIETIAHLLLQIITVAMGSPLGREVAPRECGALLAQHVARLAALAPSDIRLLVACGAGGGLAAVYNVPLAGGLFVLEALLCSVSGRAVPMALATCAIAAATARSGLGDAVQYHLPALQISSSLVVWSVIAGPFFGAGAALFRVATESCTRTAPRGGRRIVACILAFGSVGLASSLYPELPGNGRGPIQMALDGGIGPALAIELLLLKLAAILVCLRAGAAGGLLTPGLAIGVLLAILLGSLWNDFAPRQPLEAYAIVGAAAFLASSMRIPITAMVLILEFTRVGEGFLAPISLAVMGSTVAAAVTQQTGATLWSRWTERQRRSAGIAPPIISLFRLARHLALLIFARANQPSPSRRYENVEA